MMIEFVEFSKKSLGKSGVGTIAKNLSNKLPKKLIDKFKPIILVEYLKSDKDELFYFLKNMGYKIYIGLGANYLCVPINLKFTLSSLQEVT